MIATVVDLRYRTTEVFKALERGERVTLLKRGKVKGTIYPEGRPDTMDMKDHPFFGMEKNAKQSVAEVMKGLRRGRYRDL